MHTLTVIIEFIGLLIFAGATGCFISHTQNYDKAIELYNINVIGRFFKFAFLILSIHFYEPFFNLFLNAIGIQSSAIINTAVVTASLSVLYIAFRLFIELKNDIEWSGLVVKYKDIDSNLVSYYLKAMLSDAKRTKTFEREKSAFLTAHPTWADHPLIQSNLNNVEVIPDSEQ